MTEHRVAGDDFVLQIELVQKLQCIGNLHALAARGLVAENGLQTRAKRRQYMRRMAVAVLAGAHRLAVDRDVTLVLAFDETHGAQRLRQRAPVDGAQGFGERRMTGRHAFREAKRQALAFVQAAPQMKRCQHSASSTQKRHHDQPQNRP